MSDYVTVFLETDSKGRMQIAVDDAKGAGHGYRIAGPKYVNDHVSGDFATVVIRHDLDDRDSDEIRTYLRHLDVIRDQDMPPEVHALTRALDRHREQSRVMREYGHHEHQRVRHAETTAALRAAAVEMVARLDEDAQVIS